MNYYKQRLINDEQKQNSVGRHLSWFNKINQEQHAAIYSLNKKRDSANFNAKTKSNYFIPVLITILFSEVLISTFFLPEFDFNFNQGVSYDAYLAIRLLSLVFVIPTNILIIYPVYRIVCPSMHYNYVEDTVESVTIPLMVE